MLPLTISWRFPPTSFSAALAGPMRKGYHHPMIQNAHEKPAVISIPQLPNTSHLGPSIRAALFVFRQRWILWPAIIATLIFAVMLAAASEKLVKLSDGSAVEVLSVKTFLQFVWIAPMCGFGFAVLTGLPAFCLTRLFRGPVKPESAQTDTLWKVTANHFLGDEARGGQLSLSSEKIVFIPHRYNFQLDVVEAKFEDITSIAWRQIAGPGSNPMSSIIEIGTDEGPAKFVVPNAEKIGVLVETLRSAPPADRPAVVETTLAAQALV